MTKNESGALRFKEKLGYGMGDMASNFFFQTFNIFLLYYYTDVFGISATAVGTMFFVTKLWDAINDPLMGAIADRTDTRMGKFRPYLLWMAIPYGLLGFAMFANPQLGESGKLVYAWVSYTLMMMCYTAINVPYSALMGVMTPSSRERTVLASFRFVGAFGGGLLISMLVRPLVHYLGAEDEAQGFRLTMSLFALISIAMFWFTFATTKERVTCKPNEQASLKNDLAMLFGTRPWVVLCFGAILTLAQVAMRSAVTIHYFKYYAMDDGTPFVGFLDRTSLFMTVGALGLIVGVVCTKRVTDRFDKKHALIGLSLLSGMTSVAMFFVPPDQFWIMMAVNVTGSLLAGPTAPIVWAMYADVADYGEWKFGRRTTGLVFSASMFAQKFGLTLGAGLSGWLLGAFGFVANVAQSETSLLAIRLMFTILPAVIAVLNVLVLSFYDLSDDKVARIERELEERKSEPLPQPA